jgi:hypothetical protein
LKLRFQAVVKRLKGEMRADRERLFKHGTQDEGGRERYESIAWGGTVPETGNGSVYKQSKQSRK